MQVGLCMGFVSKLSSCRVVMMMKLCLLVGAVLLLPSGVQCHIRGAPAVYKPDQLDVLQALWGNWNRSTPNPSSNLAGWSSTQGLPCNSLFDDRSLVLNWRGVECVPLLNETANSSVDIRIIGITLADASIVGTLPPAIGNISTLSTLQLTGNPSLTGPIPTEIQLCWLNNLDLHDNGFNGTVPEMSILWNLLKLDLSGNRLSGPYPQSQISSMSGLQELSLAGNLFQGPIPEDALVNKTQLDKLDLSGNMFDGPLPNLTRNDKLQFVNLSKNKFNGSLLDLTMTPTIKVLNLSTNALTGNVNLSSIFSSSLATLFTTMDLSNNQLTGDLPLWTLTDVGSLEELYLDKNNISGILNVTHLSQLHSPQEYAGNLTNKLHLLSLTNNNITDVIYERHHIMENPITFRLQGNPYCDGKTSNDGTRCYCQQICFDSYASNKKTIVLAVGGAVATLFVIFIVIVAIISYRSRRYKQYLLMQFRQKFEEFDVKPTIYSYNELRSATRDFHSDMKLGEGAYGVVYKGVLSNGNTVAVKQLFAKTAQAIDEFLNEVVLITGMKHRNLVNLKGCCIREHQRLLVYELVDNFDIEQVLLAGGKRKVDVNWQLRLNIMKGVARGLHYLHALAHPRIIHRDIKASNILLDKSFEPKIADFGLALLFPDEESHIMTMHIAGTKGYLAPEYAVLGQLSEKVDVYSFGVVCLEIISGRKNIDANMPTERMYLSHMAWELHENGNLMELVDPNLNLHHDEVMEVQRVINIALMCLQVSGDKRPNMDRVLTMLQNDATSEVVAPASPGNTKALYLGRHITPTPYQQQDIESSEPPGDTSTSTMSYPTTSSSTSAFVHDYDGHSTDASATLELSLMKAR